MYNSSRYAFCGGRRQCYRCSVPWSAKGERHTVNALITFSSLLYHLPLQRPEMAPSLLHVIFDAPFHNTSFIISNADFCLVANTHLPRALGETEHCDLHIVSKIGIPKTDVRVFRAQLAPLIDSRSKRDVIVKMALTRDAYALMLQEGLFYARYLAPEQGQTVPLSYGVYEAQQPTKGALGFLMLEECGHPIPSLGETIGQDLRQQIGDVVKQLHRLGIVHGHIRRGHVLWKDGIPVLIDFSKAHVHDGLVCRGQTLQWGQIPLLADDDTCEELYELYNYMCAFAPAYFKCYKSTFDVSYLQKPLALADAAPSHRYGNDHGKRLREAYQAIYGYYRTWQPQYAVQLQDFMQNKMEDACKAYQTNKEIDAEEGGDDDESDGEGTIPEDYEAVS
ncbi:unnamed protein product [Peniophora sp. CBMAI 1063]|nr:unnamed protein product [Peniophora sp. CBMAI 1063]